MHYEKHYNNDRYLEVGRCLMARGKAINVNAVMIAISDFGHELSGTHYYKGSGGRLLGMIVRFEMSRGEIATMIDFLTPFAPEKMEEIGKIMYAIGEVALVLASIYAQFETTIMGGSPSDVEAIRDTLRDSLESLSYLCD